MTTRVVADSWYAEGVEGWTRLEDAVPARWQRLIARSSVARGIALAAAARRSAVVVTTNPSPGASIAIALSGVMGLRRVVLLEYIVHPPTWRRPAHRLHFVLLRRVLMGRALLWAQVLTRSEVEACAASHGLPAGRFRFVPWPGRLDDTPVGEVVAGRRVLCSGRRVDWEAFFTAAHGADWDVHVVCSAEDLAAVESLAAGTPTVVRHAISAIEHQREMEAAAVYVLALPETGASIGQIRLMDAAQSGVPVVASAVRGLEGYVDETCAVMVAPGDPEALRTAVDALLADPARRGRLRDAARRRGATMADYLETLDGLVAALPSS